MAITDSKTVLTTENTIKANIEKVWSFWTNPLHIMKWNQASSEWMTSFAENDLRKEGKFLFRMESRDGKQGFDFSGVYTHVNPPHEIYYTLDDNRNVQIYFTEIEGNTHVKVLFEPDLSNALELQQAGWQAILDNFKNYVENISLEVLHFETVINASVDEVYRQITEEKSYAEWTHVFSPGSHYQGSWNKGAEILFLAPDENQELSGMLSHIRENIPNRFISIEHRGIIDKGQRITSGPEVERWAGGLENYTLHQKGTQALMVVDIEVQSDMRDFFIKVWPEALNKLKSICEA